MREDPFPKYAQPKYTKLTKGRRKEGLLSPFSSQGMEN